MYKISLTVTFAGVIYVAPGQTKEMQILKNTFGSIRYIDFVKKLGLNLKSGIPEVAEQITAF